MDRRGAGLVMAIVAAIVVSLTAVVAMNFTFQRFHLSHFMSDRTAAFSASEAGLRYAFKRLDVNDTNPLTGVNNTKPFQEKVKDKKGPGGAQKPLVISSDNGINPDHWEPNLKMGERHVTVKILYRGDGVDPPFNVQASSNYGT